MIPTNKTHNYGQESVNDQAWLALMHRPGYEVFTASLHPYSAHYQESINLKEAQKNHDDLRDSLEKNGVKTLLITDVLKESCHDNTACEELKELALQNYKIKYEGDVTSLSEKEKFYLGREYLLNCLSSLSLDDLIQTILNRPKILLKRSKNKLSFETVHTKMSPLSHMTFTHDSQIISPKGVIMCNFSSAQRRGEVELMRFCFKKLGVPILHHLREQQFLHGSDFIPHSKDLCFVGVGLSSNLEAIMNLMNNNLLTSKKIVLVKDLYDQSLERMHLNKVFNVVNKNCVVMLEDMIGERSPIRRMLEVWQYDPSQQKYDLTREEEFSVFLKKEGFEIIPINKKQQENYFSNFINLGQNPRNSGHIISTHPEVKKVLEKSGYQGGVSHINYASVCKMFGGAYSSTVIFRKSSE